MPLPIFALLGAQGRVLELVRDYMQVWFLGAVVAILPPVSDGCLRAHSYAIAIVPFIGQNYGAKEMTRRQLRLR